MNQNQYFGLKTDGAFGLVMSNDEIALQVIRSIFPDLDIKRIVENTAQKQFNSLGAEKDVRLDVFVRDDMNRGFDLEMQKRNNDDLGRRMRYYEGKIDQDSLPKATEYAGLYNNYIIFFCDFDPFGEGRARYVDQPEYNFGRSAKLQNGATHAIINVKADAEHQDPPLSEDLRALIHVLRGNYDTNYPFAITLKAELDKVNNDPVTRRNIMTLQTRLAEEKAVGLQEGLQKGLLEGRQEVTLDHFNRLVTKFGFAEDQALNFLGITKAELECYKELAAKTNTQESNKTKNTK